ncbi:hypothetical protein L7F22_053137 [Adiantum nelumboides]|nr:hypothetical protein [Adiantum nelumboides]
MRTEVSPDAITYDCTLKACAIMPDVYIGKQSHDEIVSQGVLENTIMINNASVDMYAKCGVLLNAHQVLQELSVQDVVSWNSLTAGHVRQGKGPEPLNSFQRMRTKVFSPDTMLWTTSMPSVKRSFLTRSESYEPNKSSSHALLLLLKNNEPYSALIDNIYEKNAQNSIS